MIEQSHVRESWVIYLLSSLFIMVINIDTIAVHLATVTTVYNEKISTYANNLFKTI